MDRASDEKEIKPAAGASSAEERCPICLEDYEDKAFIDACFHAFCFGCIVKAVEMTTGRCPMCKTAFDTVIHNVRAIDDYDRVKVQSKPTPPLSTTQQEAFRAFRGYRTTRLPGQPSQRETTESTSSSLDSTASGGTSGGSTSSMTTAACRTQTKRRKLTKFGGQSRKPAALERRRAVYSTGLRAMSFESTDSKRVRVRDISAAFFSSNPASTHRLFPWLTREFKVLVGDEHVEFMLQLMQSLIDKIDMESAEFKGHLEPFLHEKTQHFMHELVSFAKSPYDMIAYDNKVRYNWPEDHPQAEEQTMREGDGTSDASSQPGPSGIQQWVLQELMLTRWDDSPPLHSHSHSCSHSPTIFISSDSSDSDVDIGPESTHVVTSPHHEERMEEATTVPRQLEEESTQISTLSTNSNSTQVHGQSFPEDTISEQCEQTTSTSTTLTMSSVSSDVALEDQVRATVSAVLLLEGTSSGQLLGSSDSVESCPEVSSSAALEENDTVNLNNEVSSTSGNGDASKSLSLPLSSSAIAKQTNTESLSREGESQFRDQLQEVGEDDGDFEISVYAEDGGASLGGEGTPTSDILIRRDSQARNTVCSKSTKVDNLKKRSGGDVKRSQKYSSRKDSKSRYYESEHGSSRREHKVRRRRSSERDKERRRHHKHSHRRSRLRSHSRSRSRSHQHHPTTEEQSRARGHLREERSYKEKRRRSSHRSRSRSRSSSAQQSYNSSDDDTSSMRKRHSRAKMETSGRRRDEEKRERDSHKVQSREREGQKRRGSQSQRQSLTSHHPSKYDYHHQKSPSRYERKHRSRLYSEGSWSKQQQSSHMITETSTNHPVSSSGDTQMRKTDRKKRERPPRGSPDDSDEEKDKSQKSDKTKKLAKELNEVDREIQDNKKELLKSMLRKERLELLQRNLHGDGSLMSGGILFTSTSTVLDKQLPTHDVTKKTTSEMERELELLNRAITDGKKQLLRVLKKVEEDQLDDD